MAESKMQRGAREANEESHAAAMGHAVGSLSAFIVAINELAARITALEAAVLELKPVTAVKDAAS